MNWRTWSKSSGGAGSELHDRAFRGTMPPAMRPQLLFLCLLLPACGNLHNLAVKAKAKHREKELQRLAEAATSEVSTRLGEKAVGEVVYVDGSGGYVLVRARSGLALPPGQELQGQKSAARLKITPERKSVFVAADIVSGSPEKSEPVLAVKSSSKPLPKLVPVTPSSVPGVNSPDNTLYVDPSSIRPEDIRPSTLDEPRSGPGSRMVDQAPADDAANLLLEPPLPETPGEALLPPPRLNP